MALTMRVSAQADFAQLKREMKGLNNEFSSFKTNVGRGFGQGFLTSTQSRAMGYAQKQMADSIRNLNTLLDEQESKIRKLASTKITSNTQNRNIKDEIEARRKNIDSIQAEIRAIEDRQKALNEQAKGMKVINDRHDKTVDDNSAMGKAKDAASTIGGIISKVLGIAGIAGLASFVGQSIDYSTERHKMAAVLGSKSGATSRGDFDAILGNNRDIGLRMGYNGLETMQQMDSFMRRGGAVTGTDIEAMQLFARGKGEDINGVIPAFAELKRFGASQTGQQTRFADMISTSITKSGMQERSAEALETLTGLVGDIAQDMPNVDASGLAAIQTILASTGEETLKGERGGDIISALNGIITSKDQNTEFAMLRAIGWGNGKSYYEAKLQAEGGATAENVGALMKFIQGQGYNAETQDIMMNSMSGGKISLNEAKLLREKVGNNLSTENIRATQNEIKQGGSLNTEAGDYMKSYGAYINRTNAELNETMAKVGEGLMFVAFAIKSGFDQLLSNGSVGLGDVANLAKDTAAGSTPGLGSISEFFGLTAKDAQGRTTTTKKGTDLASNIGVIGGAVGAVGAVAGAPIVAGAGITAGLGALLYKVFDWVAQKQGHGGIADAWSKAREIDRQEQATDRMSNEATKARENTEKTNSSFLDGFQKFMDDVTKGGFFGGTVYGAELPKNSGRVMPLANKYADLFNQAGAQFGLDPYFLSAVGQQESGLNPNAEGTSGERGIMQLMPYNWSPNGISDPTDPKQSIFGGAGMLAENMAIYKNPKLALAAYNAGKGSVDSWISQANGSMDWDKVKQFAIPSTAKYVDNIMALWGQNGGGLSPATAGRPGAMPTAPSASRLTLDLNVNLSGVSPENEGSIREIVKQVVEQTMEKQQVRTYMAPYAFR